MHDVIRTVEELEECGPYAWPGGYPLAFYPVNKYGDGGDVVLCYEHALQALADPDEYSDGLNYGFVPEIIDADQLAYGSVKCDVDYQYIAPPQCPECGDELYDGSRLMHADNVDASLIHLRCAVELVGHEVACRVPGKGVVIVNNEDKYGPWYAPVGTVYTYK